jgi:hypothetical protein
MTVTHHRQQASATHRQHRSDSADRLWRQRALGGRDVAERPPRTMQDHLMQGKV